MKTNLENYEERFVDYMEGLLDAAEMREVEAFVAQHPELEEDFKLFCATKLEADPNVVYTKKDSLMKSGTVVRPLLVRIVAAAACVALLIGIGIHFLKPRHGLEQQPMLAELSPIEAQPIGFVPESQGLRKSGMKAVSPTQSVNEPETIEVIPPVNLIATVPPIAPKSLEWNDALAFDDTGIRMAMELGERLSAVAPAIEEAPLAVNFRDYLKGNVSQTAIYLYKQTAKNVMSVYYTADYCINEAKDQLMASR